MPRSATILNSPLLPALEKKNRRATGRITTSPDNKTVDFEIRHKFFNAFAGKLCNKESLSH